MRALGDKQIKGGREYAWKGEEGIRNLELAGGLQDQYSICDATHWLTLTTLKRHWGRYFRLRARWEMTREIAKAVRLGTLFWRLADLTRPIRHPLGIRLSTFARLASYLNRQR